MSARLPGALAVALLAALFALAAATMTGPALAVEEDELEPEEEAPPPPDIEELCVEGTIAEAAICMQGTTIQVESIERR